MRRISRHSRRTDISASDADGAKLGVVPAASLIFFAFYGFDTISTAAEETKNPARDLAIGIVGSMVLCTAIYMVVAASAIGALPTSQLAQSAEPLALALRVLNHPLAATLVATAAIVALPTVIMVFMYGQSRIFFVMARDGLLPRAWSAVNAKTGTPVLDDHHHRRHRCGHRGLPAAERNRRTRQCRNALRLYRGRRLHDDPADFASPNAREYFARPCGGLWGRWRYWDACIFSGISPALHKCASSYGTALGLVVYVFYAMRHSRLAQPAA